MTERPRWMNDSHQALYDLAYDFFSKECEPHEKRWSQQQHIDREVWNKAGSVGLLCASIPEEYGGGGGDFGHEAVILQAQMRAMAPSFGGAVHSPIVAHYILSYGSQAQRQTWLPRLASGEAVGAIAMTEPGTGSDLQSVRSSALRDGAEYVINGSKTFITNGLLCDVVIVVVKTDPEEKASGVSLILVETDRDGFSRGRNLEKVGQHGQDTCELFFDNVRVPATNLLGEEGKGFIYLMEQLPQERLTIAVPAVVAIEGAVELTVAYTKEREAFGRPIFNFQHTKFTLAECDTIASVARAFLDQCIDKHLVGELSIADAAKAKWWLTEQQNIVADRCLQLFGGYGYMTDYPIARIWTDSRIQKIYGGTNEIMKEIISRFL